MKTPIEKRKPKGVLDYLSLALTTFGVGYIPGAPGTYGSILAVAAYLGVERGLEMLRSSGYGYLSGPSGAETFALIAVLLLIFSAVGIWAADRSIPMLGNSDANEAVVDEVLGQLITFAFVPFGIGWPFIFAGFLLFRLFDILKPYPINLLQDLPGGLGICADDIVAGVYAGVCLAVGYAILT